jgi:hypothetical protein
MDIHRLLNTPRYLHVQPSRPPLSMPTRLYARETTRSDRIRIKSALNFATPRTVHQRYIDQYGYTLRQICLAKTRLNILQRAKRCRRKPVISIEKTQEIKAWLLSDPSYRHVSFRHLPAYTPELGLQDYGFEAIRTVFQSIGYGRRIAKRKGFSDDLAVIAARLAFAQDRLTWSREHLYRQVFSDEVWAYGGAFTQSWVTCLIEGEPEEIQADRYCPECLQHKYGKQPAWMFYSTIYAGKKGLGTFWEKD